MNQLDPISAMRLAKISDTGLTVYGVDYSVSLLLGRAGAFGAIGAVVGGGLGWLVSAATGAPHPATHALMAAAGGGAGAAAAGFFSEWFETQVTASQRR
jgi:hypothetical protein